MIILPTSQHFFLVRAKKRSHPVRCFHYSLLSNRLQDGFCSLGKIIEERTAEVMHRGAIMLANYMEDIVADSGQICSNQLTLYKHRLCSLLLQGR
jgi:hypothetical protein